MKKIKYLVFIGLILVTMTGCVSTKETECTCNCEEIKEVDPNRQLEGKEFTRTYMIYNVAESNDYEHLYLTIRQFQAEEIETVQVKRKDFDVVKEDVYYEIKFKITSNDIEDNIKSIFENTEIVKASETSKTGLEQVNEDFE